MELKNILKTLMYCSEVLTMSQFEIVPKKKILAIQSKKKNMCYYIRMIILIGVVAFCTIHHQLTESWILASDKTLQLVNKFCYLNLRTLVTLSCVLVTNFKSNGIVEFLKTLIVTDSKLRQIGIKNSYKTVRNISWYLYALLGIKILLQIIKFSLKGNWTYQELIYLNLPRCVTQTIIVQWTIFLCLLHQQCKSLNNLLKSFSYRKNYQVSDDYSGVYRIGLDRWLMEEIFRKTGLLYEIFYEQSQRINKIYVQQIFLMILESFVLVIHYSFNICQMIRKKQPFSGEIIFVNILHFTIFFELIIPSMCMKNESDKIVDILHKVHMKLEQNKILEEMINWLLLQLNHQRIGFSAYDLFPLDSTLIHLMFGTLTTYLVIMVQFDT